MVIARRTGDYRPLTGPLRRVDRQVLGLLRQRRLPPVGMYLNHDDLCLLAGAPPSAENVALQGLEKEVVDMKCRVGYSLFLFIYQLCRQLSLAPHTV